MSRTIRFNPRTRAYIRDGVPFRAAGSCNNNGGCPICEGNRLHKHARAAKPQDTAFPPTED